MATASIQHCNLKQALSAEISRLECEKAILKKVKGGYQRLHAAGNKLIEVNAQIAAYTNIKNLNLANQVDSHQ